MKPLRTHALCDAFAEHAVHTPGLLDIMKVFPLEYPMFNMRMIRGPICYCPYANDRATMVEQIRAGVQLSGVLVIENYARADCAAFDYAYLTGLDLRNLKGIIVNGAVRMSREIRDYRFSVRARGIHPMPWRPLAAEHLDAAKARQFASVKGYVVGDEDGLVILPREDYLRGLGFEP
jgi:regulator of RNase E activity RraA